ncbi:hypothetical protein AeMF1_012165 [Aphanomyces euteiches]|nr:hypothetical protein AeMF1_012165 [Aphanomyces euteiches]
MRATIAYAASHPITVHWMGLNTDKAETRDIVFASYAQLYEQNMQGQLVPDLNRDGVIFAGSLLWESIDIAGEIPILRQKQTGCSRYALRNSGFYVQQTSDVDESRVSIILSLENESGYVRSSKWMHGLAMCIADISKALRKIELVPKMLWKESEHCSVHSGADTTAVSVAILSVATAPRPFISTFQPWIKTNTSRQFEPARNALKPRTASPCRRPDRAVDGVRPTTAALDI